MWDTLFALCAALFVAGILLLLVLGALISGLGAKRPNR